MVEHTLHAVQQYCVMVLVVEFEDYECCYHLLATTKYEILLTLSVTLSIS